ncbi:MAG TPA: hypothetical protein VFK69_02920 [Candidatus Eisenbacteria bacterium]|nr:hypothetical protein [Candidatus Eisenbacteria bacterium]
MSRDSSPLPRRQFLHTLGLAGLTAAVRPAMALAQSSAPPPKPVEAKPAPAPAATKPEAPSEDARALAAMLGRRYSQLTPEQVELIAKDIDGDLQAGKRLREAKLANSDEPDVVFRPGDMPANEK